MARPSRTARKPPPRPELPRPVPTAKPHGRKTFIPHEPLAARKTSTALAVIPKAETALAELQDDLATADELSSHSTSVNTRRAYEADLNDWRAYAASKQMPEFPATVDGLRGYIGAMKICRL